MKKRTRFVVILVLITAAVAIGTVFAVPLLAPEEDDREIVLFGNVEIREVQLAFQGSERIASVAVDEGDRVEAGQELARLEVERLEQRVASARGRMEAQAQELARLEAGSRPEEIARAEADVRAARAEAENARHVYERRLAVRDERATSLEDIDRTRAEAEAAEARLSEAQETLRLLEAGPRQEDIAAARATLEALRAELALARRDLADGVLRAPSPGIIRNRLAEMGDMASPSRPVFTLALHDPVWVRAYVPEPDLGKVRPGATAWVTTDSFPGKRYEGKIGFVSPTAEFTPKSVETRELRTRLVYRVRVLVPNPEGELRLGMPTTVTVPLPEAGEGGE